MKYAGYTTVQLDDQANQDIDELLKDKKHASSLEVMERILLAGFTLKLDLTKDGCKAVVCNRDNVYGDDSQVYLSAEDETFRAALLVLEYKLFFVCAGVLPKPEKTLKGSKRR